MTMEVKRTINLKKRHYVLMKREATAVTLEQYHRSLGIYRTLIRKCKRDHEKGIAREAKTNPNKFFYVHKNKKEYKKQHWPHSK